MRSATQVAALALAAWLLAGAGAAEAQATVTFAWDYRAAPADVATYTQIVTVDGALVTAPITCGPRVGAPTETTCSVPIAALAPGAHTLSVTAQRGGASAESRFVGIDPSTGPKNAENPRVTVTVTITVS